MATISMVDEFAKYAKIQRKVNKMMEELGNQVNQRMTSFAKMKFGITYGLRALTGLVLASLLWILGDQPVLIMPPDWLQPVSGFLGWPTGIPGAISLASWLLISGTVARLAVSALS